MVLLSAIGEVEFGSLHVKLACIGIRRLGLGRSVFIASTSIHRRLNLTLCKTSDNGSSYRTRRADPRIVSKDIALCLPVSDAVSRGLLHKAFPSSFVIILSPIRYPRS
jgi:hypothetical protein